MADGCNEQWSKGARSRVADQHVVSSHHARVQKADTPGADPANVGLSSRREEAIKDYKRWVETRRRSLERVWTRIAWGQVRHPLADLPVDEPRDPADLRAAKEQLRALGFID